MAQLTAGLSPRGAHLPAFLLLALCALALPAHASYGQMRLDGISFLLAFALVVVYGVVLDIALLLKLFRYRAALIVGLVLAVALIALLAAMAASPSERLGYFKGAPGGEPLVVLVLTCAVFLPFLIFAPLAQYRAMHDNRRWPVWVPVWMALQVALLPAFHLLGSTEEHYWKKDYAAGRAVGDTASAGGLGAILEVAALQRERIWGTAWRYPWGLDTPAGYLPKRSAWIGGLARGVDGTALVASSEPLSEPDRTMLRTLVRRHFAGYAIPNIRAKLIWDALEPGGFSRQLAPHGLNESGVVSDELIPLLLQRLEGDGAARLCPGGRMLEADRALLSQLVLARARAYEEARKRDLQAERDAKALDREMSEAPFPFRLAWQAASALKEQSGVRDVPVPDWSGYPQRVERICGGPA